MSSKFGATAATRGDRPAAACPYAIDVTALFDITASTFQVV